MSDDSKNALGSASAPSAAHRPPVSPRAGFFLRRPVLSMVLSSLVGTVIPIFFKKIHIDPAVASGPLITTVNDLVAVVAYYGLAYLFFFQIFHLV